MDFNVLSTTQGHLRTGSCPVNHTGSPLDRITSCQPHGVTSGQDYAMSTTRGHPRTGLRHVNHTGSPQDRITSCQPHGVTSGQDYVMSTTRGHLRTGSRPDSHTGSPPQDKLTSCQPHRVTTSGQDQKERTVMIILSYDKNDHSPTDRDSLWPHADSKFRSCKTGWRLTHRETQEL